MLRMENSMILAEKITALRKQMGWSQEELANQLSISRQSVSKWELGATIPDLDKILKMSELFGVSTDYLLKDEIEETAYTEKEEQPEGRSVSAEDADLYMKLTREISGKIATAAGIFVLSPICLIQMSAYADAGKLGDNFAGGIGMAVLLLLVAIGVITCVSQGAKREDFKYLEHERFTLQYGVKGIVEKKKKEFRQTYTRNVTIGVSLYIIGVIPIFVAAAFEAEDFVAITCVSVLLLFVAAGTVLITKVGVVMEGYKKLLQEDDYTEENKNIDRKVGFFPGAYWLLVTAVYLGISFVTQDWGRTWIVWPVAGVAFAALNMIVRGLAGKNRENDSL